MSKRPDICLVLEGTYPYVRGGVSSWVHQLIEGMSHLKFYLVFVGGTKESFEKIRYTLPKNVVKLESHFIMEPEAVIKPRARKVKIETIEFWHDVLSHFLDSKDPLAPEQLDYLLSTVGTHKGFSRKDFLFSEQSWNILIRLYEKYATNQPFIDFFWTFRNIYNPLFKLIKIARNLPSVKMVHSVSTGFAGFLAALISYQQKVPYMLSEHGIYTKERKIDLNQAQWIVERHNILENSIHRSSEQTRQMWITFFEQLGRTSYAYADRITALYQGNRRRQIADGASPERTEVIVNGIDPNRFENAYQDRPQEPPEVAALVGRVVPIKDIKTFIRAIAAATQKIPNIQGWVVGPTEEDPSYYQECRTLVTSLGLEQQIKFLGMQDVSKIFPQVGVCVLTSISEAQPLVLLEAMACGIPCIASRVGSCDEIILGMNEKDREIGPCGWLTDIASPNKVADALKLCFEDKLRWLLYGERGRERVLTYYHEDTMYSRFKQCYEELLTWQG